MSNMELRKRMILKLVKKINLIVSMKSFTKPNFNLCMEEYLTILKNLQYKHVTLMKNNLDIYRACQHKTTFHQCFLRNYVPVAYYNPFAH